MSDKNQPEQCSRCKGKGWESAVTASGKKPVACVLCYPVVPHPILARQQSKLPLNVWRCEECGIEGTFRSVNRASCSAEIRPCRYCGCAPECAPDCAGIWAALGSSHVHVVGDLSIPGNPLN